MKSKDFDDFSFKAPQQSQQSIGDISSQGYIAEQATRAPIIREIRYRHIENNLQKNIAVFDTPVNKKINQISQQLEENIKRRIELEEKLSMVKKQEQTKHQKQVFFAYNNQTYKSPQEEASQFNRINKKADHIDRLIKEDKSLPQPKQKMIEKNKQILLDYEQPISITKQKILIPIIQQFSSKQKGKSLPVYTVPDQIKIQTLLRRATFPQTPKGHLEELKKQIQNLYAVHSPHSDIHYLLMVVYFHLQNFLKVRKNYEQILNFKKLNMKAHWIAAESQFQMQNYDLCLQLAQECMQKLQQKYLPRFIYLKAKSYQQIGNYVNSVICFNQLIKMKPKISEYYLQRGIIYHRIGYYKESKEDFVAFGILKPNAQEYIKEKVLCEKKQNRKKEYIALLARMF